MSTSNRTVLVGEGISIPKDNILLGMELLLDFKRVSDILERHLKNRSFTIVQCEGTYIRYKPETNCIVAYSAICENSDSGIKDEILFYAKCYTAGDYALASEKASMREFENNSILDPVISLSEHNVIFYAFPHDPEMKELIATSNNKKIVRILYDLDNHVSKDNWRISDKRLKTQVIRYKPEKRSVTKITTRITNRQTKEKLPLTVYLRTYSDNQGETVYHRLTSLVKELSGQTFVRVPRPLIYVEDKKYLITESLNARTLSDSVNSIEKKSWIRDTAKSLAVLHSLKGIKVLPMTTEDLLANAGTTGDALTHIVPEKSDNVQAILDKLTALNSENASYPNGFVHGDFHCGQILLGDGFTGVLDFDRSFYGETIVDVGNFCAHLHVIGMQSGWEDTESYIQLFIREYEAASQHDVDRKRLILWTGFGLFLFAIYPFRVLKNNWKSSVLKTIGLCEEVLA